VVHVQRLDARRVRLRRIVLDALVIVGAAVDVAIARAQARQSLAEHIGTDLALPLAAIQRQRAANAVRHLGQRGQQLLLRMLVVARADLALIVAGHEHDARHRRLAA
jgi:hypothetical protein